MGRLFLEYLNSKNYYVCFTCNTHLVDKSELTSKVTCSLKLQNFHGKTGKAYLFNKV